MEKDWGLWSTKRFTLDEIEAALKGEVMKTSENVFEGKPDTRQSDDVDHPVSRFRPRYRALEPDELALHDQIKDAYAVVEELIMRLQAGRYRALALTTLEESCMWAVKELTGPK